MYKRLDKYYENPDGNGVQFPYKLEVIIAKSSILNEKSININRIIKFFSLFTF